MTAPLVLGHDRAVADWAAKRIGCTFERLALAVGAIDGEGALIGAMVLHDRSRHDVEISATGKGVLRQSVVSYLAWVIFVDWGCDRATIRLPRWHKKHLRFLDRTRLFSYEGIKRRQYGPRKADDGIMFGMIREEAERLLVKRKDYGTSIAA